MVWGIRVIDTLRARTKLIVQRLSIVILVSAFPFFFLGGAIEVSSSLLSAWWDCGHLVFFIALVAALSNKFDVNKWRVCVAIILGVFVGGGLIEVIQAHIGRDGNWEDLFRDLAATVFGLFWFQRNSKWSWLGRLAASLALIPTLTALFFESWHYLHTRNSFPLLSGFESQIETYGFNPEMVRATEFHTQGLYSLKIKLTTNLYSGIKFARLPRDWRGFNRLSVDIYNADTKPFMMSIRVNDSDHKLHGWDNGDRFNRRFRLEPGWNQLSFGMVDIQHAPKSREMDLANVAWLELFVGKLPEPKTIYLDNLRLE